MAEMSATEMRITEKTLPRKFVGTRVPRKEDQRLVSGRGRYLGDIKVTGLLHAAALRSTHAHARINGIDASAALELDGVVAFYSASDLAGKVGNFPEPAMRDLGPAIMAAIKLDVKHNPMPPLPAEKALWVGQPIGYVVATSPYIAEDALEQIVVDYEPLPPVIDPEQARDPSSATLHDELGTNVQQTYHVETGDVEGAFASAPHTLRVRLSMGRQVANAIEPRGILAEYHPGRDEILVHSTNTRPHLLRSMISEMLDMPADNVRCVGPDIGGSFGTGMYHEDVLIPFLARDLGRPVRWIEDRRENLQNTRHSRDQIHEAEVAFDDDGTIRAVRDNFIVDFGAHNNYAITVSYNVAAHFRGPFHIDNFAITCTGVLTNKAPASPIRGAGRPECTYVMERLVDLIADELNLDPIDVRRRNLITPEQMPYPMGIPYRDNQPIVYDQANFPEQLDQALDLVGMDTWRKRQKEQSATVHRIGIGVASFMEASGVGPHEGAVIRVDPTGRVSIFTGAQNHGQGLETTLTQVAADQLGVDVSMVTLHPTDTAAISYGIGTMASRSAVTAGSAVVGASVLLREKILAIAGEVLEVSPADLEMVDGQARVKGDPSTSVSLRDIASAAAPGPHCRVPAGMEPGLQVEHYFIVPTVTWSSGTHAAVVEVDTETGAVKILSYASADDCGQMLNPMVVEGQVHGGIAHGIGNALLEEARYDSSGQPMTSTYMDYLLPSAVEVPAIAVAHQEYLSKLNPIGIKGVGEGGAVAPPAAIAAAIVDALRPLRVRLNHAPATPEAVLRAIQHAQSGDGTSL